VPDRFDNEESTAWVSEIPTILGLNRTQFQRMEINALAQKVMDHLNCDPRLRDEFKLLLNYWSGDMVDWQKKLELVFRGREEDVSRVRSMVEHIRITVGEEELGPEPRKDPNIFDMNELKALRLKTRQQKDEIAQLKDRLEAWENPGRIKTTPSP
jgi:hypothetical protein